VDPGVRPVTARPVTARTVKPESAAVITGFGSSEIGRRLGRDPLLLTADAALAAIADAGLSPGDIDGVSTYPGALWSTPGITGAGVDDVRALLGLRLRWHTGGGELPGQLGSVVNAVLAIATGLATHVLCFRTVWESTAQDRAGGRSSVVASSGRESMQWGKPYGAGYPTYGALAMQRYMSETGATREQFAQLAVVSRANAAANPAAVYREPMTVDDYLEARMISDPLCMFDCDVPVDGAVAVVVSDAAAAAVDRTRAIRIESMGSASGFDESADMLWSRTELAPSDVDVAEIYDGFTIYAVRWLEALRLTPRGETGPFIEGGKRIALDGELPVSTGGGQLSGGRLHGYGALLEACIQLRGLGGARQVPGPPGVAVVSSGAESFTSCLLLTR
jgi:acetyl-CoA acetyltransferase